MSSFYLPLLYIGKRVFNFPYSYPHNYYANVANVFSSPTRAFGGVATGDVATADNARVITENRFRSAAVGDERTPFGKNF